MLPDSNITVTFDRKRNTEKIDKKKFHCGSDSSDSYNTEGSSRRDMPAKPIKSVKKKSSLTSETPTRSKGASSTSSHKKPVKKSSGSKSNRKPLKKEKVYRKRAGLSSDEEDERSESESESEEDTPSSKKRAKAKVASESLKGKNTKGKTSSKKKKDSDSSSSSSDEPIRSASSRAASSSQVNASPEGKEAYQKLASFLSKYYAKDASKANYLGLEYPKGSFNIPDDKMAAFINLYLDVIQTDHPVTLVERHSEIGPVVIDLDFVTKEEGRFYTDKTLENCVRLYNNVIRKYLDVTDEDLEAYVTEKPEPTFRSKEYHDGVHIYYPKICTTPALRAIMRNKFIKSIEEKKIFVRIPHTNSVANIVDEAVVYRNGVVMYGSVKKADMVDSKYSLTKIYHPYYDKKNKKNVLLETWENDKESRRPSRDTLKGIIKNISLQKYKNKESLTTYADSVDPAELTTKIEKMKKKIASKHGAARADQTLGRDAGLIRATTEKELAEARNLVKLFSPTRAEEYHKWMEVGRCLHNIDYRLLKDWISFSKKCAEKFKEGECEQLWKKFKPSKYTMGSLHYYASVDSPKKYIALKDENVTKLTKQVENIPEHYSVAKLLVEMNGYRFKCASIKQNLWYEFKNHRWVKMDDAYSLRNCISEDLSLIFADRQRTLFTGVDNKVMDKKKQEKLMDRAKGIIGIMKKLCNNSFKNGVVKECASLSYDPNFLKNIDENNKLICFENGVYDLEGDYFRDGCPDDYITFCTGYAYTDYDEEDPIAKKIDDFLTKIQPDPVMKKYLLMLLSTCCAGSISEESFYVFTGSGANGKSKLMELLRYSLGDYFKSMDVRLLTEKRSNSSSASPEVADKKGVRACTLDEPNSTDKINTGFMKLFTGGDEIMARALYSDPVYFRPQFKPFLLCNKLPNIDADDDGTWRRLRVIPFNSKFVKPSDMHKYRKGLPKNHFEADLGLSQQLEDWKQVFASLLIVYYRKYVKSGSLRHPPLVVKYTDDYKRKCDVYQDFLIDCLDKSESDKDTINIVVLHDMMKKWYKSNYDGKPPSPKDLREYLEKRTDNFNSKKSCLFGYKVKINDNDGGLDDMDDE